MTFVEMQVKWSVTLTDRLDPEILINCVRNNGTSFASCAFACEGWLLNLNALLAKKLPKFLSRLNEMSGGRENMCLVSGSFH